MSKVVSCGDNSFQVEVLAHEGLVLVDFWATWCSPCKILGPVLEAFAEENANIKVVKVDVDENEAVPRQFGIRGVPTLMLFQSGKLLSTKVGALTKAQLESFVKNAQK